MKSEERSLELTIMLVTIIFETNNNISVIEIVAKTKKRPIIRSTRLKLLHLYNIKYFRSTDMRKIGKSQLYCTV
jgi:hypothetical protein